MAEGAVQSRKQTLSYFSGRQSGSTAMLCRQRLLPSLLDGRDVGEGIVFHRWGVADMELVAAMRFNCNSASVGRGSYG